MRILFHHRIRSKDGQFVHLEELTRAMRRLGHEVLIVGPRAIDEEQFGSDAGIVDVLKRTLPSFIYELLEFAYSLPAYLRLSRAIRSFRPDVIYERYQLFFPAGIWAQRRYRIPLLLEVNAPLLEERARYSRIALTALASWSERFVWGAADRVMPVTAVLADKVFATGVPGSRVTVIPNGIDFSRFAGLPDAAEAKSMVGLSGRTVLGFIGFIRDWHGLDRVVRYIASRNDKFLHLMMIGDGPEREPLLALARQLGVEQQITATGIVPRDEVGRYLAAFDIALQPDVTEYASPLKLFEYMYVGLAVIAPDTPNIREILSDGEDAVLFSRRDEGAFEAALDRLLGAPDLRLRVAAAAKQTILKRDFTWDGNARRVVELAVDAGASR